MEYDWGGLALKLGHDGVIREAKKALAEVGVDSGTIETAFKEYERFEAKTAQDQQIREYEQKLNQWQLEHGPEIREAPAKTPE